MRNIQLRGIGGWLILVLIGLISALVKTIFALKGLLESSQPEISVTITRYITGGRPPIFGVWVLYEVIFNAVVIVFITCLLILMISKSRFFPIFLIVYLIVDTFLYGIDYILGLPNAINLVPSQDGVLLAFATAVVWIPYLLVSKRVKATFLNKDSNINLEKDPIATDI